MSSDGSVSSRISQFGLYRTIDARTEEFLKLSKKRQIKQGCICAAVSTALTVIIVVTVLLIYEYNVIAEARKTTDHVTWLGLMNSSADDINLIERLNKEKMYVDKTTLKLLPILLRVLKQNKYIEKIIEEPTSSLYTPYEKEVTTETGLTKNIFADTRNWMKTPHSRLYTVEYKTSPLVYFKNPTRNIEYFTKIRKIRDYQRILNYVDKMINEKNSLGTTQPMRSNYGQTEKPFKRSTLSRKHKPTQKVIDTHKTNIKIMQQEKKTNCQCSHRLSEIMNKLLSSIQQLLSYFSRTDPKENLKCNKNYPIKMKQVKSLNIISTTPSKRKSIAEGGKGYEPKITEAPPYKTFLNRHKYTIDFTPTKSFDIRRDYTINAIMNLIKPNFNKHNEVDINFELSEADSTTNSYVKSLEMDDILKESSSKSYPKQLDFTDEQSSINSVTTVSDYILQKGSYDVSPDIKSPLSSFTETDFEDDDDYAETTAITTNLANNIYTPDSIEMVNKNKISETKKKSKEDRLYPFKGINPIQKYNHIATMRKTGNLVFSDQQNSVPILNQHRFAPNLKQTSKLTTTSTVSTAHTTPDTNYEKKNIYTTKPKTKTTEKPAATNNKSKVKNTGPKLKQNETRIINENTEKVWKGSISDYTNLKHIEEAFIILNNDTKTTQVENYNKISPDSDQWEMVRIEGNTTSTKSMIPRGRTTYLEMQRNDWKHDDNHDFDNDINNYIFD